MSFLSKLFIDGKEITALDCLVSVEQNSDVTSRPTSKPIAGQLSLTVQSSKITNEFSEWSLSPTQTKNGKITFYDSDSMSIMQNIEFKEAYCLKYTQHFNSQNNSSMNIQLIISAKDLKIGAAEHSNNWPTAG